jgi:glycerate dehydrogenase
MKNHAILLNMARGGIVDEQALANALQMGEIGGAGIDVLIEEPPVNGNLLLSLNLPNLIITPHIAWAAVESRQRLINIVTDNIKAYSSGKQQNRVD